MQISNSPAYDAAMEAARLLGGNFKMVRERKRALALDLVKASVVEGFALAEAIKAAKSAMKWARLASDEQSQMNVLFNAVRVIDGAWKALPEDRQKAFLAGELVFSTLAKDIKDAEKKALEAEAKQADAEEQAEANREAPVGEDGKPLPEPEPEPVAESALFLQVAEIIESIQTPQDLLASGRGMCLDRLVKAVMDMQARMVPAQDEALAA